MSAIALAVRRPFRWAWRPMLPAATLGFAFALGALVVRHPGDLRLAIAVLLAGTLLLLALLNPQHAIVALLSFLAFMGLIRRLLIPSAGWSAHDPILLVAPAVALFLFIDLFVRQSRPLALDRLSRFVLAFLALTVVEAFNPSGGSLLAGVGGLLFAAIPLLWFFIGRELATRRMLATIFGLTAVFAVPVAFYGLYQTNHGLPSWDRDWVAITGYSALQVGSATRAFGTMASAAEYAYYLAIAMVVALVAALHRRVFALPALPLFGYALYLESSRGIIVLTVLSALVLVGLRASGAKGMLVVVAAGVTLAVIGLRSTAPVELQRGKLSATNPLQTHLVGGLQHPLSSQSDLSQKYHGAIAGIKIGFTQPFGQGTGSANLAGDKFGGTTGPSEEDLPKAFSSFGLLGGFLFIPIVLLTLRRAGRLYLRSLDVVSGIALGLLVVTINQWLGGGYYAVAPLIWLTIGWICREEAPAALGRPR